MSAFHFPCLDARFQVAQMHCFVGDIFNSCFVQQVQFGVQIIGVGVMFALLVFKGYRVALVS